MKHLELGAKSTDPWTRDPANTNQRSPAAMAIALIVATVLIIAVISTLFWALGGTLQSVSAPLVPEYPGAAVTLSVTALAVWSIYLGRGGRLSRSLTVLGLAGVALFGTAVWLGPLRGLSSLDAISYAGGSAPLIAQFAALGVTLLAAGLLLKISPGTTATRVAAEICVLGAFLIGVSAILIYAYGDDLIEPFLQLRRVRVPAGLSITLLAVAVAVSERQWLIHRAVRRMGWGAGLFFAVLFVLLALTGLTWRIAQSDAQLQAATQFASDTATMGRLVEANLNTDIKALKGGSSLFAASDDVDRASWKAYVDGLNLSEDYPGVQGFGYAEVVPADRLTAVEDTVRAEGFPDFTIFPVDPPRDIYTTIIFLLPFDERNQKAFGYDMFSEPTRHSAMARARDTGDPAMTGQVTLLQENSDDVQKGFLIYEPVYRRGSPTATIAQRAAAIQGYVYSPFRMNDFIDAALGDQTFNINFEVFDQDPRDPNALVQDNLMYGSPLPPQPGLPSVTETLYSGGHGWLMRFTATPDYVALQDTKTRPQFILYSGLLVSVTLALATYLLASSRQRAVSIAGELTEDLEKERDAALLVQQKDEMLLDGIIEGMLVFDRDGVIERVNAATETMLGMPEEELVGRHYRDVLLAYDGHGRQLSLSERPVAMVLRNGHMIANAVVHYQRRGGNPFPALMSVAPLVHNDELYGAIEIFRDISEERRLDKAKDEFVSVASHQLRTPITAQGWLLDILSDGETVGQLTDAQLDVVRKIAQSNERLADLVAALLNVTRLESGRLAVTPAPTDLVELTQSVIDEADVGLAPRNQRVDVTATALPRLNVDPVLLRQVILNLITNAGKYSPDGSTIHVEIELVDDHVVYSVRDNGFGIPAEQRGLVFTKFFRADNILHRQTDGNGLGLYLVKSIVELSGGRIWFDSTEDEGTTFTFTLPLSGTTAREGEMRLGLSSVE